MPIDETHRWPQQPYGRSKRMAEDLLRDHCAAHPEWRLAILRN